MSYQAGGCKSSVTSTDSRGKVSEFEDVMHKRRVFSKIVMRLSTRYKSRVRKMDFREGIEADNARQELGAAFFTDMVDVVGRFRDDVSAQACFSLLCRCGMHEFLCSIWASACRYCFA